MALLFLALDPALVMSVSNCFSYALQSQSILVTFDRYKVIKIYRGMAIAFSYNVFYFTK